MFAKEEREQLRIYDDFQIEPDRGWHLMYANLDFQNEVPRLGRRLAKWLSYKLPESWDAKRIMRFLKKHQEGFRQCLDWISKNCVVDFGRSDDRDQEYEESELLERWRNMPAVRFLKTHALDHARLTLEPGYQVSARLVGLKLVQPKARDPLDPICWYMLSLLAGYGTVFVRRCAYRKCGKFFSPRTSRKRFHSDSCRALQHAENAKEKDPDKFRKARNDYMRRRNSLVIVKRRAKKVRVVS